MVALGALLLIGSLAFAHLMALPAFEDEGSQLRSAWRLIEARDWLQPLSEGKPLEAWLMAPLLWLGGQPLAAIRAVHVLAGMIGAVLTWRLALHLAAARWTAWVAGALFAICPFVVYLQRLALADILLCAAVVWVLLSSIRLVERTTWRSAAALAAGLVVAAFCKFPVGFVSLIFVPLALVLMPAGERRRLLHPPCRVRLLAAHAPALLLALTVTVVALWRFRRGQVLGFGLQDLLGLGLGQYHNVARGAGGSRPDLLIELTAQLSGPVVLIGLLGLAASGVLGDWRQRWLIVSGALPMLGVGVLAQFWYSRYLLFALPPLIIAAVCGWRALTLHTGRWRRVCELAALAVCVGFMGRQSALLIFDPAAASWSPLDRYQYFEGPGSGYGYPQAARFVLTAPHAPSMIYSLDGHSAYQLRNYLPREWWPRVGPVFYGADGRVLRSKAQRLENLLSRTPAWLVISKQLLQRYLVTSFGEHGAERLRLRQIAVFEKPGLRTQLAIYEATRAGG